MSGTTTWIEETSGMAEGERLIAMAVAVLQDRIAKLPGVDRDELFELVMELPKAKSAEESRSIWVAVQEILAQRPMTVRPLDLSGEACVVTGKAKKWAEHVGDRIRELRAERGWTQVELAEKAELSQNHVCAIERAECTATLKTLEQIARAFKVEVERIAPMND